VQLYQQQQCRKQLQHCSAVLMYTNFRATRKSVSVTPANSNGKMPGYNKCTSNNNKSTHKKTMMQVYTTITRG